MNDHEPMQPLMNPLPPSVAMLALAIFGVELLISAGTNGFVGGPAAIGWRTEAIRDFGFSGPILQYIAQMQDWTSPEMMRLVTYPFIHFSFTHMLMVVVFLLAMGKLVGETFGNIAVVVIFFGSAIFGALVYGTLAGSPRPLVGGYPAVYGLIGGYTYLLWVSYGQAGRGQAQAFTLIGFLLGIQLLFGLLFGGSRDWVAEVSGFLFGFAVSPMVAPGGVSRLVERLRQR